MGKVKKLFLTGLFAWAGRQLNKRYGGFKINKSGQPNKRRTK